MKQTPYLAVALAVIVAGIFLVGSPDDAAAAAAAKTPPPLPPRADTVEDHCGRDAKQAPASQGAGCTRTLSEPGKQDCCGS